MKISATSHSNPSFGVFHVLDTESSPASKTNDTLNKFVSSEYNNFGKEGAFTSIKGIITGIASMPREDIYVKAQYDERYGGDHSIILEAYLDSEGEHMIAAERMVKSSSDSTYDEHRHNFMQQIYNNIATNRANHNQRNWTYPEMLTNFLSQFKS